MKNISSKGSDLLGNQHLDFREWPAAGNDWATEVDIGTCQLAGAGAVGNAIVYALQFVPVRGQVDVIDPKNVNDGILNRCLWFDKEDIDHPKAEVLAHKAQLAIPGVKFIPYVSTLRDAREAIGEYNCMLVGVDSRRARRNLQNEIPLEVFDASTTGVEEVVFHHNHRFDGHACMGCIYFETEAERRFAHHVAETLNVSVTQVDEGYISLAAAQLICLRYTQLKPVDLVNKAYDSLFRELCATEKLITPEQKQVLAPFAFVSQLAGTILAIELYLRRLNPERSRSFNYWRANPWRGLVPELQQVKETNPTCEVCLQDDYRALSASIWKRS
jgi:molybdopterin/thiamine biosynthesis adenylyltransferase